MRRSKPVIGTTLAVVLAVSMGANLAPASAASELTNEQAEQAVRAWWKRSDAAGKTNDVRAVDRLYVGQAALQARAYYEQATNLGEDFGASSASSTRRAKTLETYRFRGSSDRFVATWKTRLGGYTNDEGKPSKVLTVTEFVRTGPRKPWRARLSGYEPSRLNIASDGGTLARVPKPAALAVAPDEVAAAAQDAVVHEDASAFTPSSAPLIDDLRGLSGDNPSMSVRNAADGAPLVVPLHGGGAFVIAPFDLVTTSSAPAGEGIRIDATAAKKYALPEDDLYNPIVFANLVELAVVDPARPKKQGAAPARLRVESYSSTETILAKTVVSTGGP